MAKTFDAEKALKKIDDKINRLTESVHSPAPYEYYANYPYKQTWVKYGVVQRLTGWDKYEFRHARTNGLIKFKVDGKGLSYLLESLNPIFFKKT